MYGFDEGNPFYHHKYFFSKGEWPHNNIKALFLHAAYLVFFGVKMIFFYSLLCY